MLTSPNTSRKLTEAAQRPPNPYCLSSTGPAADTANICCNIYINKSDQT